MHIPIAVPRIFSRHLAPHFEVDDVIRKRFHIRPGIARAAGDIDVEHAADAGILTGKNCRGG